MYRKSAVSSVPWARSAVCDAAIRENVTSETVADRYKTLFINLRIELKNFTMKTSCRVGLFPE
jgi:hypothetical protein